MLQLYPLIVLWRYSGLRRPPIISHIGSVHIAGHTRAADTQ